MLDLKVIRENADYVKARLAARGTDWSEHVDAIVKADDDRRRLILRSETKKAEQNRITKLIPQMKKEGANTDSVMAQMRVLADEIKETVAELDKIENKLNILLLNVPNVPCDKVPLGKDAEDNVVLRTWGTPREFDFDVKPHWDIGADLDIFDQPRGVKVTGTRFNFMKGLGARLERSLANFYLECNIDAGFTELMPPYLINRKSGIGTGNLPKYEGDMFHVRDVDYFLVPTAEIPVTNYHADEILDGDALPLKYCAYTPCFRSEAGSAGRDTRGLIRVHQFTKVEIVKFTKPEQSMDELESLLAQAESLLQKLELPYRVVTCCTGDMGTNQVMQYDIEVWMPSYNRYVEISSCSNYSDYQARRANIRFKREKGAKAEFAHTINGSALPCQRAMAAIMENYQNKDGTITIPKVLVPYMGTDVIK